MSSVSSGVEAFLTSKLEEAERLMQISMPPRLSSATRFKESLIGFLAITVFSIMIGLSAVYKYHDPSQALQVGGLLFIVLTGLYVVSTIAYYRTAGKRICAVTDRAILMVTVPADFYKTKKLSSLMKSSAKVRRIPFNELVSVVVNEDREGGGSLVLSYNGGANGRYSGELIPITDASSLREAIPATLLRTNPLLQ